VSQEHSWDVTRALGRVVLTLRGPLDQRSAGHLETILHDLVENQGNLYLVVDLLQVDGIAPEAIRALRWASRSMETRTGTLVLSAPVMVVADALRDAGLPVVEAGGPPPHAVPVASVDDVLRGLSRAAFELRGRTPERSCHEADDALALIDGVVADLESAALEDAVGARSATVRLSGEVLGRLTDAERTIEGLLATSSGATSSGSLEVRVELTRAVQILRSESTWR
jgi:anti-anti-sigma regulatory factor